jgi:hypothetical protein
MEIKMNKKYNCVKEWRKSTKLKLFEGFSEQCGCCGLKDDPIVYDFHHLGEETKEFNISSRVMAWNKIVEEAKKCVMLCSHCHRKVHSGLSIITNQIDFDESKVKSNKNNRWGFK